MLRPRDTLRHSTVRRIETHAMSNAMERWETCDGVDFLGWLGLNPGDRVVDFGCRVGHYTIPAAFAVGVSGVVYAIDKDSEPVTELMAKARKYRLENIKAIKTSGQPDIDVGGRSIDMVLLYDVLHYFTHNQRRTLFHEVFRVLKSTGLLSVYPKHTFEDCPSKELKDLHVGDVEREICGCGFQLDGAYEGMISHDDALVPGRVMNFRKQ